MIFWKVRAETWKVDQFLYQILPKTEPHFFNTRATNFQNLPKNFHIIFQNCSGWSEFWKFSCQIDEIGPIFAPTLENFENMTRTQFLLWIRGNCYTRRCYYYCFKMDVLFFKKMMKLTMSLRWLYCPNIILCNFVSNDLLYETLIAFNAPWFTFPFICIWWHHDDIIKF